MSTTAVAAPAATGATVAPGRPSRTPRWLFIILGVTAVGVIVSTWRYGIGMTPDSVTYLDGARSLAHGHGYTENGSAITSFAPGYSAVVSILVRVGLSAATAARLLAVVTFMILTWLSFLLLRRHVRQTNVLIVATAFVGCSAVLLGVFEEALSEHLFLIDSVLLLLVAEDLAKRPRSVRLLIAATLLVWAGFYLRFAGIMLVPFMAAVVLITSWGSGRLRAFVRGVCFGLVGLSVPVLWMMRNEHAGGAALGPREDAAVTIVTNIGRTATILGGWLAFNGPQLIRWGAFFTLFMVGVGLVVWCFATERPVKRAVAELWPIGMFVVGYVAYLIATASVVAFAALSTRFLSPVFIPLVVLGAWAYEHLHAALRPKGKRVLAVLTWVFVAANFVWFGATTINSAINGAGGYETTAWHQSQLIEDVGRLDPNEPTFTNDMPAVELFTGRNIPVTVEKTFFNSNTSAGELPGFIHTVECARDVKLIWFLPNSRPRLYTPEELSRHVHLVPAVHRSDGVIYDVTPLPSDHNRPCH